MKAGHKESKDARAIVEDYLGEAPEMPGEVRARIEGVLGGGGILIYAVADLDDGLAFSRTWVAAGRAGVALAPDEAHEPVRLIEIGALASVELDVRPGFGRLLLRGAAGALLAELRFTHRWQSLMARLQFVIEESVSARPPDLAQSADEIFLECLAAPVRRDQGAPYEGSAATILRLAGYLRPYRGRVAAGMAAAVLLAIASLAPP
ncbi:MAG: hypothetical protein ACC661_07660, partial [Verrucomicrobiales bacterium]